MADIGAGFHRAVARLIGQLAQRLQQDRSLDVVALSGGVFQNRLLVQLVRQEMADRGQRLLTHRLVPPNDGGLALGQAAIASFSARRA